MKTIMIQTAWYLLISFTAVGQFTLAQQPTSDIICKAQPINDFRVKGRSSSVQFPDGRSITVVGHNHGDRQIYEMIGLISSGILLTMPSNEFVSHMKNVLVQNTAPYQGSLTNEGRHKITDDFKRQFDFDVSSLFDDRKGFDLQNVSPLAHAQEDYSYLLDLVKDKDGTFTNRNIKFVGFEGTEQILKYNFPSYLEAKRILLNEFKKRQGQISFSEEQIQNIMMSSYNGSIYVYMNNPNLTQVVPMVGVESVEDASNYSKFQPLDKMAEALARIGKMDDTHWESQPKNELEAFRKVPKNLFSLALMMHIYEDVKAMNINTIPEFSNQLKLVDLTNFPWIHDSFQELIAAMKLRIILNNNRDFDSARNLVGRHQSGIHFVGLNHYRNTVRDLEHLCTNEKSGLEQTVRSQSTP